MQFQTLRSSAAPRLNCLQLAFAVRLAVNCKLSKDQWIQHHLGHSCPSPSENLCGKPDSRDARHTESVNLGILSERTASILTLLTINRRTKNQVARPSERLIDFEFTHRARCASSTAGGLSSQRS